MSTTEKRAAYKGLKRLAIFPLTEDTATTLTYGTVVTIEKALMAMKDAPGTSSASLDADDQVVQEDMVAVYFTAFPKEAERIYNEAIAYEEEEEKRQDELSDKLVTYIGKMKKDDLQQALLQVLFDGPEWQYDKFIREYMEIW